MLDLRGVESVQDRGSSRARRLWQHSWLCKASLIPPQAALGRFTQLNERLNDAIKDEDITPLRIVVDEFFTETAVLKWGLCDKVNGLAKTFEIPCSAYPRFSHINSLCGVTRSLLTPLRVQEFFLTVPDPLTSRPVHVGYLLKADSALWSSNFEQGVKVELEGSLNVHFVVTADRDAAGGAGVLKGLKIEAIDFQSRGHEEYFAKESILYEQVEKFVVEGRGGEEGVGGGLEDSPTIGKKKKGAAITGVGAGTRRRSQTSKEEEEESAKSVRFERRLLPISPVGSFGITEMGMRCLEIAESVAQLQDLMGFAQEARIGPIEALTRFSSPQHQRSHSRAGLPLPPPPPNHQGPPPAQQPHMNGLPSASGAIANLSQNPSVNAFYSVPPPRPNSALAGPPIPTGGSPKRKAEDVDGGMEEYGGHFGLAGQVSSCALRDGKEALEGKD
ncbi:LIM binding protein [Pseudohyphozyma bogoriensis]|nr:LIM binding protein [Pseudohyphozyma bogoriensis]